MAALFVAGCGAAQPAARSAVGASSVVESRVVDFAFDSLDERPVSAEAMRGRPSVLTFITTSSLPAQAQMSFLVAMAKHDPDRVAYAAVAVEPADSRELVELYAKALHVTFPVAMAGAPELAGDGPFGDVRAVPVTVILDRAGRAVWRVEGRVVKADELRAALRGL